MAVRAITGMREVENTPVNSFNSLIDTMYRKEKKNINGKTINLFSMSRNITDRVRIINRHLIVTRIWVFDHNIDKESETISEISTGLVGVCIIFRIKNGTNNYCGGDEIVIWQ